MNRSMMPKQVMAYGNGGGISSLASVPMETTMAGQPHRLAYVNPQEEQMMLNAGGAGLPGPGGIPSYWNLFEPSTWAGGSNYEAGKGYEGLTSSSNDSSSAASSSSNDSTPTFNNLTAAANAGYHGQAVNIAGQGLQTVEFADSSYNNQMSNASAAASNDTPGIIDSILMGTGLKKKTAGYEAATAENLANQQAQQELTQSQYNPTANDDNVQSGGGGGGGGGGSTPVVVAPTVTPFTGLTDSQLAAQANYSSNVATYLGQYDQNQLSDITQRNSIYGSNEFKPSAEQFSAITGLDEEDSQVLLRSMQSNDLRDWSKIMGSDNPLESARAATAALYMTDGLFGAGQTLHTGQMVDAVDNVIGETDQLYAYSTASGPNSQYGVGNVGIGIKTSDGLQLTQLGPLGSPTFGENLARFGYGAEDMAELIPQIQNYYNENFEYTPNYQPVGTYNGEFYSDTGSNFQYSPESIEQYNSLYGDQFPIIGTQDGITYANKNLLTNPASDPFGYMQNLQSYVDNNPYTTPDLETGQGYLLSSTPGFYGQSPRSMIDEETYYANLASADALKKAKEVEAEKAAFAAKYSSGTPAAANNSLQGYNAITPSVGVSNQGIGGLPSTGASSANNPLVFNAYMPETYNPIVPSLRLPPLA